MSVISRRNPWNVNGSIQDDSHAATSVADRFAKLGANIGSASSAFSGRYDRISRRSSSVIGRTRGQVFPWGHDTHAPSALALASHHRSAPTSPIRAPVFHALNRPSRSPVRLRSA